MLLAQTLALPARARLAARLLQLGGYAEQLRNVCLPQAQIAELVGVSRKTVNLLLNELADESCIATTHRGIRLLDRRALAAIARGDSLS